MNYEKFIYKKMQIQQEKQTYYYWYLINKENREGVHFHGAKIHDLSNELFTSYINEYGFKTYGIEQHSKTPLYPDQEPVKDCEVTCGDCYCSGTSLYASENLGDVNPDNCDPKVWMELEYLYKEWFENHYEE